MAVEVVVVVFVWRMERNKSHAFLGLKVVMSRESEGGGKKKKVVMSKYKLINKVLESAL